MVVEAVHRLAHPDGEQGAVGQPGQRVVVGQVGEPLLVALLLGHVVHGDDRAELPAVLVDQGLPVDAHLALFAARRGQDDLDVAEPLPGHGQEQRVLLGVDRRAVGVAQHPAGRDPPDRLDVVARGRAAGGPPG